MLLNHIIADVCFKAGYIDSWGRGTIKIIDACKEANLPDPQMSEEDGGFLVTVYKTGVKSDMTAHIIHRLEQELLSKSKIARKLSKDKPNRSRCLNDLMNKLLENGIVQHTIPDKPNSLLQKYRLIKTSK